MEQDSIYAGELLVKLCELSRSHNIDIRVRQDPLIPNAFEIRLDRKDGHAAVQIDISRTFKDEPERAADYAFHRALFNINELEKPETYLRSCFGKYYNENGLACEDGFRGLCSYCVECQKADPNY